MHERGVQNSGGFQNQKVCDDSPRDNGCADTDRLVACVRKGSGRIAGSDKYAPVTSVRLIENVRERLSAIVLQTELFG